jgi:Ca2+-binding RTX toxin-like protein
MYGGAGNDVYFVDNAGDVVIENVNEGNDTVYASIDYGLTANVDNLILQGSANLQAYGNLWVIRHGGTARVSSVVIMAAERSGTLPFL